MQYCDKLGLAYAALGWSTCLLLVSVGGLPPAYAGSIVILAVVFTGLILLWTKQERAKSARELQCKQAELDDLNDRLSANEEELRMQIEDLLAKELAISRKNECLEVLHEAAVTLMRNKTVDGLLKAIVTRMMAMCGAQFGYIYLLDSSAEYMRPEVVEGYARDEVMDRVALGQGIIGKVWESGRRVLQENYQEWPERLRNGLYERLRAGVGLPLRVENRVIGVFSMNYTEEHRFDKEELEMLDRFAEMASIALGSVYLTEALDKSQSRSEALLSALPDLLLQFSPQGALLDVQKGKYYEMTIHFPEKVGLHVSDIFPPPAAQKFERAIAALVDDRFPTQFEYCLESSGGTRWFECRMVISESGRIIAVIRNITEKRRLEQQLRHLSFHDSLTGLYNRAYFEREMERLDKAGTMPVGLIVCDIDGLKLANDTLGHQAGDQLLIHAAQAVRSCFAETDVIARVGGDEFAILLPGRYEHEVVELCDNLRRQVADFRERNTQMPASISLGMSMRRTEKQQLGDVFKTADDNMYREKLHSSQSGRSSIVHTLAKALEARDFVTDGHADRLQELVAKLAQSLGMPDAKLPDLRLFARFHDIGKVGVPDHILFKPGRLTVDEFIVMQRHCEIGYRIAQASADLSPIADWILKHQEWWNGEGYPLHLRGSEIPLPCRILAVVDAYDAMTNDRPYRSAMSGASAIAELDRCAGSQFDPKVVEVFKYMLEQAE